jgi:hypothetical protein
MGGIEDFVSPSLAAVLLPPIPFPTALFFTFTGVTFGSANEVSTGHHRMSSGIRKSSTSFSIASARPWRLGA